jgi:hypothetical protein
VSGKANFAPYTTGRKPDTHHQSPPFCQVGWVNWLNTSFDLGDLCLNVLRKQELYTICFSWSSPNGTDKKKDKQARMGMKWRTNKYTPCIHHVQHFVYFRSSPAPLQMQEQHEASQSVYNICMATWTESWVVDYLNKT